MQGGGGCVSGNGRAGVLRLVQGYNLIDITSGWAIIRAGVARGDRGVCGHSVVQILLDLHASLRSVDGAGRPVRPCQPG